MKVIAIIPSRMASTRLPRKALELIDGQTLIQLVYKRIQNCISVDDVVIATDHEAIAASAREIGAPVIMTSSLHISGTDRIAEALQNMDFDKSDIILNVQGDEPLISHKALESLISKMKNSSIDIATLQREISSDENSRDPNMVKVVSDKDNKALYFSRADIPLVRDQSQNVQKYHHIGVYAFRAETLLKLVKLQTSALEKIEKLEQLRWLYHGFDIHLVTTDEKSIGVDTPNDLEKVRKIIGNLE